MKDSIEVKKAQVQFRKRSKVIQKDKNGRITKIQRGRDGMFIEVGMETPSGKILSIEKDSNYSGGMKAETGRKGQYTSIPSICLPYEKS